MSIKQALADQIKSKLTTMGGDDLNANLNAIASSLSLTEDDIVSYMFGDIESEVGNYSDNDDPSVTYDGGKGERSDDQQSAIDGAIETTQGGGCGDGSEDDDMSDLFSQLTSAPAPTSNPAGAVGPAPTPVPAPTPTPATVDTSGMDPALAAILNSAAALPNSGSDDASDDDDDANNMSENPRDYVFAVGFDATQSITTFVILEKTFWDTNNCLDDSGDVPDWIYKAGFLQEMESVYATNLSSNMAIAKLINLGVELRQEIANV